MNTRRDGRWPLRWIGRIGALILLFACGPSSAVGGTLAVLRQDGGAPSRAEVVAAGRAIGWKAADLWGTAIPLHPGTTLWRGLVAEPCGGAAAEPLPQIVARSKEHVLQLRSSAALAELQRGAASLPCLAGPADRALLLQFWALLGQAAQDESRPEAARAAYRQLLQLDPGHRLDVAAGSGYDDLWNEVRRESLLARPSSLVVFHVGRQVHVDGVAVAERPSVAAEAVPGRHLLQWVADGRWTGAWVMLGAEPGTLVFSDPSSARALLSMDGGDPASRGALAVLLADLRTKLGADSIATVGGDPYRGVVLRGSGLESWPAEGAITTGRDRVWTGVSGGWAYVQGFHNVQAELRADVRVAGPLHATLGVDLLARPLDPSMSGGSRTSTLPQVFVGLVGRATKGPARFWAGGTFGLWFYLRNLSDVNAATQLAVVPSGLGLVGLDLVPRDGAFFVRLSVAAGYGLGFQCLAGAGVGVRWGS